MRSKELLMEDVNRGFRISNRETKFLVEEQQQEIEELKKSNKALKDIISADVKQNAKVDYVGKIPKKTRI